MNGRTLAGRRFTGRVMFILASICTGISLSVLFLILGYIFVQGISSLNWNFLFNLPAPVGETGGGIANAIVGTMKMVGLASVIGILVGVGGAIYLAEFGRNRLGFMIRFCADVLNGVPSIVVGIVAYALIVIPMKKFSALAGVIALSFIMIPLVLRNTEEFIRLVPQNLREAALALGVPPWKVTMRIVLPTAARGILTGCLLSISRISGETAPLIFTAFGNRFWGEGWLEPVAALPLMIYTYSVSPYEDWHRQAWSAALLLMLIVLAGNILARSMIKRRPEAVHV